MEGRSFNAFAVVQVVAVAVLLGLVFSRPGPWDLQRSLGTALMIAGLGGIATSRYYLGKSFAIKPEAHQLVTRGVYSKIRNPIYVFGLVMLAGVVMALHRPVLWLLFLAVVVIQIVRAHREAQVLEAAFGDAYREYRRNTWF